MGGLTAVGLILTVYLPCCLVAHSPTAFPVGVDGSGGRIDFFCLAGKTLVKEVREVFKACDRSLDAGRRQVARIVGRDTGRCLPGRFARQLWRPWRKILVTELLPLCFGMPFLDCRGCSPIRWSTRLIRMIGYKNERYGDFGYMAANIDDIANWIPGEGVGISDGFSGRKAEVDEVCQEIWALPCQPQ